MCTIYARLINHYKFKYNILFSAGFCKIIEEDQRSDESELFVTSNNIQNLTGSDIINIGVKSQVEK